MRRLFSQIRSTSAVELWHPYFPAWKNFIALGIFCEAIVAESGDVHEVVESAVAASITASNHAYIASTKSGTWFCACRRATYPISL